MITPEIETFLNIKGEMSRFWYSAQSLLVVVANISKLLWPPSPRPRKGEDKAAFQKFQRVRREEAKELRESLNIDDDSPLKNRNLRDHFEHFDERIARLPDTGFNYVDANISSPGDMQINNAIIMRHFNPYNYTIEYHGDIPEEAAMMRLEPVMIAIKNLRENLDRLTYMIRKHPTR